MFVNMGQDIYIMEKKHMVGLLAHHGGRLPRLWGKKAQNNILHFYILPTNGFIFLDEFMICYPPKDPV